MGYGSINVDDDVSSEDDKRKESSIPSREKPMTVHKVLGVIVFCVVATVNLWFRWRSSKVQVGSVVSLDGESSDQPYYYHDQIVDHFDPNKNETWTQRYYISDKYFGGPGSPIFMIIGGEGPALRLFYPFITEYLASDFRAFVLEPELRFYGTSQPIKVEKNTDFIGLLNSEQAMADDVQLLEHIQRELKCSPDRSSKHYCPVIAVGGSYPGFLAALMRIAYPEKIDMAYAASAPLHLYAQEVNPNDYFELVTRTAERASAGCSEAVRQTLNQIRTSILSSSSLVSEVEKMNICVNHIPNYINSNDVLAQEILIVIGQNFADFNMDYYPPSPETSLAKACSIFQDVSLTIYEKMDQVFQLIEDSNGFKKKTCGFDLRTQVPDGANATISAADWTGVGEGKTGLAWDFQCCTELIVQTGFSSRSMFYPREWGMEWLTTHCLSRFGVTPAPTYLVDKFHFNDLSNVSHILFTNGLNDGWSASSVLSNVSPGIATLNFANGAHHSDLTHIGPTDLDTEDIRKGMKQVKQQIGEWLDEVRAQSLM